MAAGTTRPQAPNPVLDAVDAGLIVLDRERRIVGWNAWMEAASGRSAGEVLGKELSHVFPDTNSSELVGAISSALDSGASRLLTHALHPRLFLLKTRSGIGLLHDVTVSAVDGDPQRLCLVHIADVTMAVRRERFLRNRQNARYDAVVASAPDAILTLDAEGVIRLANRAAATQFGYADGELIGETATVLFGNRIAWNEVWQKALGEGKSSQPVELEARRKDGSLGFFEVSASQWLNGTQVFVTAIFRDINERRAAEAALRASEARARAAATALEELNATLEQRVREGTAQLLEVEEALRQSQKMEAIGQLTGGIAHDFNNLLQGISGTLDVVQKRIAEGRIGDIDRFLKGALASTERATALTHRLLAFSRRQPIDPRPLDLNRLISTIEELLRRSIGEKTRMRIAGSHDLWLVRCDANQLENAILNLAINARDAMPNGGTMTIATSNRTFEPAQALVRDIKPGEYVCMTITDDGAGMPPEVQARAFDPFFTTKPIGQGTGLGLSMIYGFVRQSAGSVRIESKVGKGTTIEICMPRFAGEFEPGADEAAEAGEARAANNEVVLVVEDEDIVRLVVVEVLNDMGYRALEAVDGSSALRILNSSQRIDLLVTDIGLPDVNGKQIADTARFKRPGLRILFMTGYAESAASSEFLDEGMEIIPKPFTMAKLAEKIQGMFEKV
jgi:PAS domain S-box-containing protein